MRTMQRPMLICATMCVLITLAGNQTTGQGQQRSQPGPGPEGDSVLKLPGEKSVPGFANPSPSPGISNSASPPNIFNMWSNQPPPAGGVNWPPAQSSALAKLAPRDGPDPNQEFLVRPESGPWMISITSYTGPDAPMMAHQLVLELRHRYQLPAYVYNYGAEERRKEYERVKDLMEQQRRFYLANNQPLDQPVRVCYVRIEEQCGVLVGDRYQNEQQARQALDKIRRLTPLDPSRVQLHTTFTATFAPGDPSRVDQTGRAYVNPFQQAFLVRNPTIKSQRPSEWDELDIRLLKKLNADETYSLFRCPRAITLAVAQFHTPAIVQPKSDSGSILESWGLVKKSSQRVDVAALNAHSLAELLANQCGLKAYVLHTQYSSVVTVGEFDAAEDRELLDMQSRLASRLRLGNIPLFPVPMPMRVPR